MCSASTNNMEDKFEGAVSKSNNFSDLLTPNLTNQLTKLPSRRI